MGVECATRDPPFFPRDCCWVGVLHILRHMLWGVEGRGSKHLLAAAAALAIIHYPPFGMMFRNRMDRRKRESEKRRDRREREVSAVCRGRATLKKELPVIDRFFQALSGLETRLVQAGLFFLPYIRDFFCFESVLTKKIPEAVAVATSRVCLRPDCGSHIPVFFPLALLILFSATGSRSPSETGRDIDNPPRARDTHTSLRTRTSDLITRQLPVNFGTGSQASLVPWSMRPAGFLAWQKNLRVPSRTQRCSNCQSSSAVRDGQRRQWTGLWKKRDDRPEVDPRGRESGCDSQKKRFDLNRCKKLHQMLANETGPCSIKIASRVSLS
ncbi:hypothetical protein QBC47DRAFT_210847 [Echria macrotheca]|uniref:Uncharacterized protein n=1 Tax=Echria macrotheca TaxID=438768 RepID=A0AAJ0BDB5_9PEZI|nr:hypothetical protein QBC47DRAFT_210847 [Echria macrotheca]